MLVKSATYKIQNRAITISIPILFVATVIFLIYSMGSISQGAVPTQGRRGHYYEYETVKGFFMQSEDDTDDTKFDFREHNFGLIDRNYDTDATSKEEKIWKRFEKYVRDVAGKSEPGVHYKILFLGRHGQGWHNVAESKYGTEAWDCYWSMLDGAEGMIWADAHLTSTGQQQARDVHALWKAQIPQGILLPETYYVSPLTRTIQTADLSFQGLDLPHDRAYKPFIKELIREALGVHTCDKRSTGSEIASAFPHLTFEPGFSDLDLLWEADYREPRSARKHRLSLALDDIFAQDSNIFLSVTSHSGAIGSILEAIGHRKFALETGGVIPVFVRAEKVHGQRETPPKEPSEGPPACEEPPNSVLS